MLYGFSAAMGCAGFRTLPGEMGGRLAPAPAVRRTLQHHAQNSSQTEVLINIGSRISLALAAHLLWATDDREWLIAKTLYASNLPAIQASKTPRAHSSEGEGVGPGVCATCAGTAERMAAAGLGTAAGVTAGAAAPSALASVSIGCAFSLASARTTGPAHFCAVCQDILATSIKDHVSWVSTMHPALQGQLSAQDFCRFA